jgi:DsbC/DsbD-like thiol-disulfide interchange protein
MSLQSRCSTPPRKRHDDGASVSLIYRDEVVFPLVVTPADIARPVTVNVEARFGVCRDICIPTSAKAEVTLAPSAPPDALAATRLSRFRPRVPKPPQPGHFDVEAVTLAGDTLEIELRAPDSGLVDLFSESPAGWYLGQPTFVSRREGVSRYRLALTGRPPDAQIRGQSFRFVATSGREAIEEAVLIR